MSYPFVNATIIRRAKVLSKFISVQLVVQVLGLASGILLVRTLRKEEYAYFTIANTMQGTMNILADSGMGSAIYLIGGKVWQDRYRFGQLVNTAIQLRRHLAVIAIAMVTPVLLWMLSSNGASISYSVLITLVILIELNFYLANGVLGTVPRLHSQINRIQNLALIFAGSRLTFLVVAYWTFLNAATAVFLSMIASGLQNLGLRYWVTDSIDIEASINREDQEAIWKTVKSQAPYCIFYCVQGQLTILLISIFGRTQNIAEVGALGRLGVIFSVIGSIMSSIVLPSYARCQEINLLRLRYWQIIGGISCLAVAIIGIATIFSRELLWILGEQYAGLQSVVVLMVASAMLQTISATVCSLNIAKGWVKDSWLIVPLTIITQVFLLIFLDVSTVKGVITFGLFSILPTLIVNGFMSYKSLKGVA